jgi:hypothetical protein
MQNDLAVGQFAALENCSALFLWFGSLEPFTVQYLSA